MSDTSVKTNNRFPSQARFILGNEAAERYSYYGMKGILALYITNMLVMSRDQASITIHLFSFANYFMPLFGAWVSDRFWGRYKTILLISLSYCAGHGVMALSDAFGSVDAKTICLYAGLALIAFGSGGIKPCVSAFMGDQFGPDQRHLLPKAYAAFYWCINLGSTAAFLTIPYLRKEFGYSWAFGVPGIAMAVATFVFWLGRKRYVMVPPTAKTRTAGFMRVLWTALSAVPQSVSTALSNQLGRPTRLLVGSGALGIALSPFLLTYLLTPLTLEIPLALLIACWALTATLDLWILRSGYKLKRLQNPGVRKFESFLAMIWGAFSTASGMALALGFVVFALQLLRSPILSWIWFAVACVGSALALLFAWKGFLAGRGGALALGVLHSDTARELSTGTDSRKRGFWDDAITRFSETELDAAKSVGPILMVFALAPIFWALFDQTFSTWVLQGEMMKPFYVGSTQLKEGSISEPDVFVAKLSAGTNTSLDHLWGEFSEQTRQELLEPGTDAPPKAAALRSELGRIIDGESLYSEDRFDIGDMSNEIALRLVAVDSGESPARLNRLLLEESFPEHIKKSYRIGPEEMLSANPILVMIFVPIMTLLVYPVIGRFATPLKRMSSGMFLAAGSFVIVAWLQQQIDGGTEMSVLWQFAPYIVLTIAEVLFSTTGLEFAFREGAASMKSTIMGFWTVTVAAGNLVVIAATVIAGRLHGGGGHDVSVTPKMFLFYAGLTFVVAIFFSFVTTFYRYRDPEAARGR